MSRYLRFERSRPEQLSHMVDAAPVAYWPLGLIEHHGWHLPVGFDGIKAELICEQIAARVGGVILPVMWWGGGGGHGDFNWTLYQNEDAAREILKTTVAKLVQFGFKVIVLMAGHYPWRSILDTVVTEIIDSHPEVLIIHGTEMEISGGEKLPGDHAAREETSYGLALLPDLIDMDALNEARERGRVWPETGPPPTEDRIDNLEYDPQSPVFAQAGVDARKGSAERGEKHIRVLVDRIVRKIDEFLF